MNYEEAAALFYTEHKLGRRGPLWQRDFPYGIRYQDDIFILNTVSVDKLKLQDTDLNVVNQYRQLIQSGIKMSPIWISVGKKLKSGEVVPQHNGMYTIKDGNHRVQAHIALNLNEVDVIMPESHFKYLQIVGSKNV